MQITAAIATAPQQPFDIREVTLDAPRPGEVLVRIAGAGVCHTDIVFRDQFLPYPLPAVFGHEGSGIVEAVGSDIKDLKPGDKVVAMPVVMKRCRKAKTSVGQRMVIGETPCDFRAMISFDPDIRA